MSTSGSPTTTTTAPAVELRRADPVGQLIGSTYTRVLPMTIVDALGPFTLPSGATYIGGVALTDMLYGIDEFQFWPNQSVLLLTKVTSDPQVVPHHVEVIAGIDVPLQAADRLQFLDCTLDGARNPDVFALVHESDELSHESHVVLPAVAAWHADTAHGTIDVIDATRVACDVAGNV